MQREEQILRKVRRAETKSRDYDYDDEVERDYNDVLSNVPRRANRSDLRKSSQIGSKSRTVEKRITVQRTDDDDAYVPIIVHTKKHHPIFMLGIGAVTMLTLLGGINFASSSLGDMMNTMKYGDVRTTNTDINVGHGGSSHFITENYNQRMVIIEFPGGDATKMQLLQGLVLESSKIPIRLLFSDVNGDGKLDMIAQTVETQPKAWIVLNDGKKFDPTLHVTEEDVLNAQLQESKTK